MRKISLLCVLALALPAALRAESILPLREGWRIQSSCGLQQGGEAISSAEFQADGWLKARVPATVLAAQVADGVFPDPYFADNLRKIPGAGYPVGQNFANLPMPSDSPYRCGWWYRNVFEAPGPEARNPEASYFRLHFAGINYRAEIWLNGDKIADPSTVAGAYRTFDFDVTSHIRSGKVNVLAVQVFAPTEKDLAINWIDWNPAPPDKDMGLWGEVDLVVSGSVTVRFPMVSTNLPEASVAELTVSAELHNATDHPVKGILSGWAAGASFEQPVELAAGEDRSVIFTPRQFPQLRLNSPKLWWPSQMGAPHMERLALRFSEAGKVIDEAAIDFGIRQTTSELTANGSRLFRINGKPLLIRGGGWAQDMLLRNDPVRLREQFRMVRDLNLNTIRLEGKLESDEFFRLADEQGILVMAGWSCCDAWEQWKNWSQDQLAIATASLRSQMLRLRSHPSMLVWLNGSDNAPPAEVERAYLKVEEETRWPNPILSAASSAATITGLNGVKMTGPYDYVAPSYWYVDKKYGGAYGFNTETSPGPAIPSLASRKKFLADPEAWPPSAAWSLHYGGEGFQTLKVFDEAIAAVYGPPHSAAEYERLASTIEYDSERAMFEAYTRNKYDSTGVIQWMLNNAWPSMIWHLYDYNLETGASYYAAKKACEPLHIQYSYDDHSIIVVNSSYEPVEHLRATVHVHSTDWKELYASENAMDSAADSSIRVSGIPDSLFLAAGKVLFIDLTLSDASGEAISRNFYWVPSALTTFNWGKTDYTHTPAAQHESLTALTQLPAAQISAYAAIESTSRSREIRLKLENKSPNLAFQVWAAARTSAGDLIAPVYWSDNWIELAPGESRTLIARLSPEADPKLEPVVQVEGWNIATQIITPSAAKGR